MPVAPNQVEGRRTEKCEKSLTTFVSKPVNGPTEKTCEPVMLVLRKYWYLWFGDGGASSHARILPGYHRWFWSGSRLFGKL